LLPSRPASDCRRLHPLLNIFLDTLNVDASIIHPQPRPSFSQPSNSTWPPHRHSPCPRSMRSSTLLTKVRLTFLFIEERGRARGRMETGREGKGRLALLRFQLGLFLFRVRGWPIVRVPITRRFIRSMQAHARRQRCSKGHRSRPQNLRDCVMSRRDRRRFILKHPVDPMFSGVGTRPQSVCSVARRTAGARQRGEAMHREWKRGAPSPCDRLGS
jgi:hypothetical protein